MKRIISYIFLMVLPLSVWGQVETLGVDFQCLDCDLAVNIIPDENTVCGATNIQLKLDIEGDYEYYWEEISNPNNNGNQATFMGVSAGEYAITVTDANGCVAIDQFKGEETDSELAAAYFRENGFMSMPITLEMLPALIAPDPSNARSRAGGGDRLGVNVAIEGINGFTDLNTFLAGAGLEIQLSHKCEDFVEFKGFYEDSNDIIWGHFIPETEGSLEGTLYLGSKTTNAPNDANQYIVNVFHSQWDVFKENVEEHFLGFDFTLYSTAQFANSDIGGFWYENLVQFYFDCPDGSASPESGGFIPRCFWDVETSQEDQRTINDLALGAGLIDGVYANTFGLQELADGIGELLNALADRPYCIIRGFDSEADYDELIGELTALDKDPSVLNWFKKRWKSRNVTDRSECIEQAKLLKKVENFFGKVFEVTTDFRKFTNTLIDLIYKVVIHFADISTGESNEDRYKLGRTVIDFAFLFIGNGGANKSAKLSDDFVAATNKLDELLAGKNIGLLDNISDGLVAKLKTLEDDLLIELEKDIIASDDLLPYISTKTTLPDGRVITLEQKVDDWVELVGFSSLRKQANHLEAYHVFKSTNNVTPKVTKNELIKALDDLGNETNQTFYLNQLDEFNKGNRSWGHIDYDGGDFQGHLADYFNVRVNYQASREQVGVVFMENNILEFHLLIPPNLQQQKLGTTIFKRSIIEFSPNKVKGNWKTSNVYNGGESINLTIFKQKLSEGLSPQAAAFETPTGKILKQNGFGGMPTIIENTIEEVVVHFNPG